VALGLLVILGGCTSTQSTKSAADKNIRTTVGFVRATVDGEIKRFRKINRARVLHTDKLLIACNSHDGLVAYDITTGQKKWSYVVPNGVEKEPAIFNNRLFFGGNDGFFYSVNLDTGLEIWKTHIKSEIVATPAYDAQEGRVYFVTTSNSILSLEAESGRQVWSYTRQDPSSYSIRGGTTPLIHKNLIYVGFSEGSFVAFNKSNGTINWEIQLNKNKRFKDIDSSAVIEDEKIYVSGYDDRLYVLSATNGDILNKFEAGGYVPVTLDGNIVYYPSTNGKVYALNKDNLKVVWEYPVTNGLPTEIAVYKDYVAFGESQGDLILANKKTGEKVSHFEPGRGIQSPIVVNEKRSELYFISGEANLFSMGVVWKPRNLFSFVE
jgi:outer membrane protein assembly factor BamB